MTIALRNDLTHQRVLNLLGNVQEKAPDVVLNQHTRNRKYGKIIYGVLVVAVAEVEAEVMGRRRSLSRRIGVVSEIEGINLTRKKLVIS